MEEKKRRPRILKSDSEAPLKERSESPAPEREANFDDSPTQQPERSSSWQEREPLSYTPRPRFDEENQDRPERPRYDNDRPRYDNDRPRYDNRQQGGGGGYDRPRYDNDRPRYDNRQQGGGGYNNDRPRYDNDRPRYDNRQQGGGGGYNNDRPRYDNDRPRYDNRQQGGGGYNNDRPRYDNDRPRYDNRQQGGGGGGYNNDRPRYDNRQQGGGGGYNNDRPRYDNRQQGGGGGGYDRPRYDNDRPRYDNRQQGGGGGGYNKGGNRPQGGGGYDRPRYDNDRPRYDNRQQGGGGGGYKKKFNKKDEFTVKLLPKPALPSGVGMPLNKYLAYCGLASRRKTVELVESGQVLVNGEVRIEPYYRIQPGDMVVHNGKVVTIQERKIYLLLNKPKNVITTAADEHGRYTVMDIVDPHYPERMFPVGRLDRDTTGLLLITNDGELAQKLAHPSFQVQKQYRVGLRDPLSEADMARLEQGVELEDGVVKPVWVRYAIDHPEQSIIELEITSGKNRIVRRMFEALGYEVYKLDRYYFAGLTKKNLQRGQFRELTQREILMLTHFTGHPSTMSKQMDMDEDVDMGVDDDEETN